MWHNSSVENLHSITCFRILHPKSSLLSSENKVLFCFTNQQKHVLFEGFLSSFISFFSFNIHTFVFLLPFCKVDISDFLKAGRQNCNFFFLDQRMWTAASVCSSLSEEMLKFLLTRFYFKKTSLSITNHGTCQWWQLQATKCPWMQLISRCQGGGAFVAFQLIKVFRETGN